MIGKVNIEGNEIIFEETLKKGLCCFCGNYYFKMIYVLDLSVKRF